ncbi:polynucleotide kinase [Roseospira marina]|uniref:Polynucleotide kinase n=1 Tax=Roseospira marina TaxID=140057 RepID=A0A5M6I9M7_9PROT|nr:polynucleotide kinase [Roseospira marina]KAA5604419.1 polynucleotide kinase [Roseospira marina]MBB4315384.1 hypothetical protein [Roseospira marina]MBB5088471.1 hypothetical protein [Roseospira marina]
MTLPCVIMDIDSTIADPTHRLHLLPTNGGSWDAFFAAAPDDTPFPEMQALMRLLAAHYPTFVVTGRRESERALTETWLREHGLPYAVLFMRANDDRRPDFEVKAEILNAQIRPVFEPLFAFEDRSSVVAMWRDQGVRCFQVCEGDY